MNKKNLDTLEYYKVLEILSGFAQSEVTADFVMGIMPDTEYDSVNEKLEDTKDAIELYQRKGNPSLGGIKSIKSIVSRLKMDADLSNKEL
ncbi:MAG: hypothetical protein JW903_08235, partial [Clostridia bacterium]|nr:hypothetical protein [Clostridia bacterium]